MVEVCLKRLTGRARRSILTACAVFASVPGTNRQNIPITSTAVEAVVVFLAPLKSSPYSCRRVPDTAQG